MHTRSAQRGCIVAGILTFIPLPASAQCTERWLPGAGMVGVNGPIRASVMWDRDGPGPDPAVLVVGGDFSIAGTVFANSLAAWDHGSRSWSALGSPLLNGSARGQVWSLAVGAANELIVGGWFTSIGGVDAAGVARLTEQGWERFGQGIGPGVVRSITALDDGRALVGGSFSTLGDGTSASGVAMWDGGQFVPIGSGVGTLVRATAVRSNGDLIVGREHSTAPVVRWSGSSWVQMGSLSAGNPTVAQALLVRENGDLIVTGSFGSPALHIARWNGTQWAALGPNLGSSGIAGTGTALSESDSGDLLVGGNFLLSGNARHTVAAWNGTAWTGLAPTTSAAGSVLSLSRTAGSPLFAAGDLLNIGGSGANRVAAFDAAAWTGLGDGFNDAILAVLPLPDGRTVVGGRFTRAGAAGASFIARGVGADWEPIGSGMNQHVLTLARLPTGDLVAGGLFTQAGDVAANRIARWDGSQWWPLGEGLDNAVFALLVLPDGDLIAGGSFLNAGGVPARNVARWNGQTWSALGGGITSGAFSSHRVNALARLPHSGEIVAGGQFLSADSVPASLVARWNGTTWAALGDGLTGGSAPEVRALAVLPSGRLAAAGTFTTIQGGVSARVAVWDGFAWSRAGGIPADSTAVSGISALAASPTGSLVAAGTFSQLDALAPVSNIARWDGEEWLALGAGLSGGASALAIDARGDLLAGGTFQAAGPFVSNALARWSARPECPADFDCSGGVPTIQDLFDFLAAYFSGLPSADMNGVDGVSIQDIFDYLFAYFSGCP